MAEAGLSLGSNLGDKAAMIEEALRRLDASDGIRLVRRSSLYRTEPWGDQNQDWFLNACALVETALAPHALLDRCLAIEAALGRDRGKSTKWGPRPVDIDVLFYGDQKIAEPGLTLPHPRLFDRAFVLVPLSDIAAGHIVGGRRIGDAARSINRTGVVPY